jgi:hypothetical protein
MNETLPAENRPSGRRCFPTTAAGDVKPNAKAWNEGIVRSLYDQRKLFSSNSTRLFQLNPPHGLSPEIQQRRIAVFCSCVQAALEPPKPVKKPSMLLCVRDVQLAVASFCAVLDSSQHCR